MAEAPDSERVDEIWVETDGFGRCRLLGNAHTFPGRIDAWSEMYQESVTISKSDIVQAPPEGWAWIDGFLSGNEPTEDEFLGVDWRVTMYMDEEDPAFQRWQDALAAFRRTGGLPFQLKDRPSLPPAADLPIRPWSFAGGQLLRWDGTQWIAEDPQPPLVSSFLLGSLCEKRGYHNAEAEQEPQCYYCSDCGYLEERYVEPTR